MIKVDRIILLVSIFYLSVFSIGNAKTLVGELEKELDELKKLHLGEKTPFEQAEKKCNELLEKYTEPEEQAMIYYHLAVVYSQSGQIKPDKTIEFSKKALEFPLDPIERLRIYIWWGDAIQIANGGVRGQDLVVARRKAVMPYLNGLNESLSIQYPKYTQPENLPEEQNVKTDSRDNIGPFLRRRKTEQRKALYEWKKARFEEDLNQHKRILTDQVSYMYSRFPWASDEIRELATKILEDETAVDNLMSSVDEAVKKRAEQLDWAPEPPDNSPPKDSPGEMLISKDKEIFIPKVSMAMQQGKAFVLDLASGKLLNSEAKVGSEQAHKNFLKLGKGDIAWDGSFITVRKAKALTIPYESHHPLKCTPGRWCNWDEFPDKVDLPYLMLVVTNEDIDYLIIIRDMETDGIRIAHKKLSSDEAKHYLQTKKKKG